MNGMMLTGKCKEDFEKWAYHDDSSSFNTQTIKEFYNVLTLSMQYGVYVDFFDSVGINTFSEYEWVFRFSNDRTKARTKAIEKANDIYNEKMVS